jgi:U32 family peptidase
MTASQNARALTEPEPTKPELTKPELMSPAGGLPQLRAAIEAGADAVYFGLEGFNARAKAMSFTQATLPDVMGELHERGVMGFVAVNTLVFDNELARLEDEILGIAAGGADAIIVQDLGVVKLARKLAPGLPVHASTQMTITSAEGAELARELGARRVVLARELSVKDIQMIRAATNVELEVFVHGALCVSYSGQCFSSEAWGGRSANRGACAQACRLPYDLMVDGEKRELGPYRYLLSPQDLYALHQIPDLIHLVDCFKIEGRYKDAEYVAATTSAYRQAIDDAWASRPLSIKPEEELALEGVYSRGLEAAFISGVDHQRVVVGRAPRHRGVKVGVVKGVMEKGVFVELEGPIVKPGDGLVFDAADWRSPQEREEGGQVFEVKSRGHNLDDSSGLRGVELRFGNGQIAFDRVREGDWVWRSHDPSLEKRYKKFTQPGDPVARRGIHFTVLGRAGKALTLEVKDESGREIEVDSETLLQVAQKRKLDQVTLEQELGKLGDTPFFLDGVTVKLEGDLFLPLSELSKVRRNAIAELLEWRREPLIRELHPHQLEALHAKKPQTALAETTPTESSSTRASLPGGTSDSKAELSVLVRRPEQLEAAIAARPEEIVLDYLELYGLRPSVEKILEAGLRAVVASPRVLKPNEERIHTFLLNLGASAILVRSLGLLKSLLEAESRPMLYGDFSLNAANGITAQHLLGMGLEKLAPTHDLNAQQIADLAAYVDPGTLEVIAHHHLPVFHTEHCVFCRFLSSGTDHTNCGHPCETHTVTLRDEHGLEHPIMADVGCRNTVFGAQAQSGAKHLEQWRKAGIQKFRLEFAHETAEQVSGVIEAWQAALERRADRRELEHRLNRFTPSGTTEGSLSIR